MMSCTKLNTIESLCVLFSINKMDILENLNKIRYLELFHSEIFDRIFDKVRYQVMTLKISRYDVKIWR